MLQRISSQFFYVLVLAFMGCVVVSAQRPKPKPSTTPAPPPSPSIVLPGPVTSPSPSLTQQVEDLSRQIEAGITSSTNRTVAVVEFVDLVGNVTNLGRFLAEELTTLLYQKRFRVVERQLLRKIIAEQKLTLTGAIDQSSAQRLGKILGVGAIVSGTVTDLGKTLRVNARLISTETGEVVSVASVTIFKDESVTSLMQQATLGPDKSSISNRPVSDNNPRSTGGNVSRKVDVEFFTFELKQCRKSTTSVLCEFSITNNDQDRQIYLSSRADLYDEFGNEARGRRAEIANSGDSVLLVSGVPVAARMTFEGVSPQATRITLLTLRGRTAGVRRFEVTFRNVPLSN